MHLKKITVVKIDHYFLNEGFEIDNLKNITLLVGDQGCGKSSVLDLIHKQDLSFSMYHENIVDSLYFDFEHMNPRVISEHELTNPDGTNRLCGIVGKVMSKFESHGETLRTYSIDNLRMMENTIVIFDEPESSLSIRSQYKLIESCNIAVDNKCQLIIATHCLPLIESQETVYSMEHKKWMSSIEFINSQK